MRRASLGIDVNMGPHGTVYTFSVWAEGPEGGKVELLRGYQPDLLASAVAEVVRNWLLGLV